MKLLHSLPPYNFCGIEDIDFEKSRAVVLPVPYDSTTSYKGGTRDGPHAMITASRNMELYDEEMGYSPAESIGIFTLEEMAPSKKSPEEMIARVESAVMDILEAEKYPVMFGGEHSISLGAIRALNEEFENVSVLQIDAHADLRDAYEETKYNHACVMRRAKELCNVVQVGIRSLSEEEATFAKESKADVLFMRNIRADGIEKTIEKILSRLSENVYVTVDLDGLDSSEMPAVGTPEPGGLHWHELLQILRRVFEKKNVVGFDVVELAPIPGNVAPDFLAAKLAYKMIAYKFREKS